MPLFSFAPPTGGPGGGAALNEEEDECALDDGGDFAAPVTSWAVPRPRDSSQDKRREGRRRAFEWEDDDEGGDEGGGGRRGTQAGGAREPEGREQKQRRQGLASFGGLGDDVFGSTGGSAGHRPVEGAHDLPARVRERPSSQLMSIVGSEDGDVHAAQSQSVPSQRNPIFPGGHNRPPPDANPGHGRAAGTGRQGRPPIPGPAGLSSAGTDGRVFDPRAQISTPLDATPVPDLPLRRKEYHARPGDPDFENESWRKLLRDMDAAAMDDAGQGRGCATVASILASKSKTKVPLLRVFVKIISYNDDSADAVLKDPSAEIRACIHGSVLEEEGDALACGSSLVLRKLTVFHAFNGRESTLIVTSNNLVRCYPPANQAPPLA